MKFSTNETNIDIIKVALSWLERGFRPCVIYPEGYPKPGEDKNRNKITIPASGKEPFGYKWGVKPLTKNTIQGDIQQFLREGWTPGLGLCLGPGRAPGNMGLLDIEGDKPQAEESRIKLFGGEIIATIGHQSVRGYHQFFSYDWNRLNPILAKLSGYQKGSQPGVYHDLPGLPDLELRIGGYSPKGELKQLQSVIPPTPGTGGIPRIPNGETTLAPVPDSFYEFLEQIAETPKETKTNGYHEPEPEQPETLNQEPPIKPTKKRQPKKEKVGNSIERWLRKNFDKQLKVVEEAAQGDRHPQVMFKLKLLAGYLHYGIGYTEEELELAGIEAANLAVNQEPARIADNPRCVREAIRYGMTLPLELPDYLHEKYIKFQESVSPVLPKPSINGSGPREPGDDDPLGEIAAGHAGHDLTDLGNSRRLVDLHGIDLRYVGQWESWYTWIGDRWDKDHDGKSFHFCEDVPPLILREAATLGPDAGQDALEWAHISQSVTRLKAMETVARWNPAVVARPEHFDKDPWQLNCTNGTLDLRTDRLEPHIRTDLILKTTGTTYDPGAKCPLWDSVLFKIFNGDTSLIEYAQTLVGYSCIGVVEHHILVFLSGDGSNGKSTFLEAVADTLGEYARTCDPDLLVENRFSRDEQPKVADLFGRRFVYTVEVKDGAKLAEGMVKRLTGGDTIKARFLYGHPFDFRPTHTIWLAANQAPDIQGRDVGIWRRIKRIPFDVEIPKDQIDTKLREKLALERSGILRWIVEGAARWRQAGLVEPHVVTEAIKEYKGDTDAYGAYFEEYCICGEDLSCTFRELYEDFKYWAFLNNIPKISDNKFSRILKSHGYARDRTTEERIVLGVKPNRKLKIGGNRYNERGQESRPYRPSDN